MASSAAAICNLALIRVGQRDFIDSLQEATLAAQVAAACYDLTRDALLEAFDWSFARRRAVLGRLTLTRTEYAYTYALPADCVIARYIEGTRTYAGDWDFPSPMPTTPGIPFATELNDDGTLRIVVTDDVAPTLVYTSRVTSPGLFSPLFTQALAWALAVEFVTALPVKPELAARAIQQAQQSLLVAEASAANEATADVPPVPSCISVRR